MLLAGLALAASILVTQAAQLPRPGGSYGFATSSVKMIDSNRTDPYSNSAQPRSLMVSVFYPVDQDSSNRSCASPYAPPATLQALDQVFRGGLGAPSNFTANLQMPSSCISNHTNTTFRENFPVLVFSPGHLTTRFLYSTIMYELASRGYIVVAVDHPYDALLVEFPEGQVIPYSPRLAIDNASVLANDISVCSKDISFVLDQLQKPSVASQLLPGSSGGFNVSRVAAFGQSLGGATAAQLARDDDRVIGVANLDGHYYSNVSSVGLDRPLLQLGASVNRSLDASWAQMWNNTASWKRELFLPKTGHMVFSDEPAIAQMAGTLNQTSVRGAIGSIPGTRVMQIMGTYLDAFFTFTFTGSESAILFNSSSQFPEVEFI